MEKVTRPRAARRAGAAGRARELAILNAVAEALNSAPDVEQALTRTLALTTELIGLPTGEVALRPPIAHQVGPAVERAGWAGAGARLARGEERSRLAREIHDTLAQGLTAIILQLESAQRNLDSHPERSRERLERAL